VKAWLAVLLVGCGGVVCPHPGPQPTTYVAVSADVTPQTLMDGFGFWSICGYNYNIWSAGDPEPKISIEPMPESVSKEYVGYAYPSLGLIYLRETAWSVTVAHELGHINGIKNHADPAINGCHVMNEYGCWTDGLTQTDVDLWVEAN